MTAYARLNSTQEAFNGICGPLCNAPLHVTVSLFLMCNTLKPFLTYKPFNSLFLVPIQDLLLAGKLQFHHTKVVLFVGGAPESTAETKLYKSIKVNYTFYFWIYIFDAQHFIMDES